MASKTRAPPPASRTFARVKVSTDPDPAAHKLSLAAKWDAFELNAKVAAARDAPPSAPPHAPTDVARLQKYLDSLHVTRPRVYTAANMANGTLVREFRAEWIAALRGSPLTRAKDVEAFDVYDALRKKGGSACVALADKMKRLADSFEYTREAASAAARARVATTLSGTVGCPNFEYASVDELRDEARVVCPTIVEDEVPRWFNAYRKARAYNVKKLEELCRELGLDTC